MPWRILHFDDTPNPNALKCILDHPISDCPRSFRTPESALGDPLATALFGVPGVCNILMNGDWITVNKLPEANWKSVKAGVEQALKRANGN